MDSANLNDFKKEEKRRERAEKWQRRINGFGDWMRDHSEELKIIVPVVGGIVLGGGKAISKHAEHKREDDLRNRYIYDRSTGQYYKTRKKISQTQHLEIERRKRAGESIGQILLSMGLL